MAERANSESRGPSKRCLVVVQNLSHYRAGVYRALQESPVWEFTFAASSPDAGADIPEVPAGVLQRVIRFDESRILERLVWQHKLVGLCAREGFDAVIFLGNVSHISTWIAAIVVRLRKISVLFWTIGWHSYDKRRSIRWLRRLFYGLADMLLLYGQDGHAIGRATGIREERMRIVGNAYSSLTREAPSVNIDWEGPLGGGSVLVGAVSRITRIKRFDLLIEAVSLLRADGLDIGVLLAGEGEAMGDLEAVARRGGVPLLLPGSIYAKPDLERLYRTLAVTVLPERAGLAVIQSLEHGVPVVTVSDPNRQVPEFRAVVPGVTGGLYRADEAVDLARMIKYWVERVRESSDTVERACKLEVEARWSVESQAKRILAALEDV